MSAANSLLDLLMQMIPDGEEQASGLFSLTYQSEKVVQKKEEPFKSVNSVVRVYHMKC